MANLTKNEKYIVEMYVRYFGTVATEEQIKSFHGVKSLSKITADIRKDAADKLKELEKAMTKGRA